MWINFQVKNIVFLLCLVLLTFLGLLLGRTYDAIYGVSGVPADGVYAQITVSPGMTLQEVARLLADSGVVGSAEEFIFAAEFQDLDERVQAGRYVLSYGKTNQQILRDLTNNGATALLVTLPEGATARRMASILKREIGLDSAAFMKSVFDSVLLKKYGIEAPSFEGFLFPDSYHFTRDMDPAWIIDMMVRRFFTIFDDSLQNRALQLGLSLNEAVTLASIIQGEMTLESEAPLISAVYHNRLKQGMKLQADPTIQYIIKNGPRRLYKGDLSIESPYNTYLHGGLPPGPVCNPGKTALRAALYPADKPYLYMVARGDGSHAFNVDFESHLKDKTRLDRIRRELAKDSKNG
jgi:UPF0755 protein